MNQHSLEGSPVRARPAGDKEHLVKTLLLAAARGTGAGVLRVVLALIAAVIVNGLGAAIVLGFSDELRGGGHGTAILFALLIGAPFFIAVGVTGAIAYKQGLMGVLSRILETQAPALAGLGAKFLEKFLRSVNYQPGGPVSDAMLGQWRKFLQLQEDLPRPLPFVLGTLASKVPFSDTITTVATTGTSLPDVARNAMDHMVERAIQGGFRPEASTLLGALGIQFALWVVLAAVLHYN